MAGSLVGSVVVVSFPFSDLSSQKLRPALVVAEAEFDNLILCQITSKSYSSKKSVVIELDDFDNGKLPLKSYARPDKLFTADKKIVRKIAGKLNSAKIDEIKREIKKLFG